MMKHIRLLTNLSARIVLIALSAAFSLTMVTPAAAQTAANAVPTSNVSPTLVSLFLLLVGVVGVGIIAARTVDLSAIARRTADPAVSMPDDSLVQDDEQV